MKSSEFIELINLVDYYNIEKLFDVVVKEFQKYDFSAENIYSKYKQVKYKPVKKICLDMIYKFLAEGGDSREMLLNTIVNGSDLIYFIEEYKKLNDNRISDLILYSLIYSWKDMHIQKNDIKHNKIINDHFKNLLLLIDLNKFTLTELSERYMFMFNDFGKTYTKILTDKINNNICNNDDIISKVLINNSSRTPTYAKINPSLLLSNYIIIKKT